MSFTDNADTKRGMEFAEQEIAKGNIDLLRILIAGEVSSQVDKDYNFGVRMALMSHMMKSKKS